MTHLIGIALALAILAAWVVAALVITRHPFRALGILVAGMAFHNFGLMVLLALGTPTPLVRVVQAWKEGLILVLLVIVARLALARWRSRTLPRLHVIDWLVLIFAAVAILYAVVPHYLLHSSLSLSQAVIGLRTMLLIPVLYLFGRVFTPEDRRDLAWGAGLVVGSAGVVGLFGLVELWLVPTATWLSWGVNQFSAWLGYTYHGPKGLPENFFQSTAEGFLLRRMVSTYISPLGIAYTGLLVLPVAVAVLASRWSPSRLWAAARWAAFALLISSIVFSLTRLAIGLALFELVALFILLRRRFLAVATVAAAALALFIVLAYPDVGPLLTGNLQAVRTGHHHLTGVADPSLSEHSSALRTDFEYVLAHPLGTGVGSSVHRFGPNTGTGESAIFDMFGDIGIVGGAVYLVIYLGLILAAARAQLSHRADQLWAALPLVAFIGGLALLPITLTSSIWSDFAVTFLFWWAAGASLTLATTNRAQSKPGGPMVPAPLDRRKPLTR
ncbi:MAG: hypothetical protein QOH92_1640 [Chloroflexota bacterium]|jgi:hypothetical protein|nr:hypothetical protein [Chloroflexota bacterium]